MRQSERTAINRELIKQLSTAQQMCRRLVDLEAKAMQAQLEGENLRQALHDCEQLVVQLRTDIHTLTQSREQLEAMYQEKCVRAADLEDLLRDRHAAETAAKNELSETRSELESERAARRAAEAAMVRMQTDHAAAIARLRAPTEAVAARAEEQRDAMSQDMAATTAATEQTMSELLHELAEKDAALVELTQQLHARHHQPRDTARQVRKVENARIGLRTCRILQLGLRQQSTFATRQLQE
ncbi:uncharacterized protein MONBRDRAFT_8110 [Monosiga brevicollis MX1]|uniref:Uncharacterized protein n=1 Tax=Monosiga brevicollis TaxID=81824 RepID=A9UZ29_MONBE|nr:uncharacterized protein MONBRDRAFT_8110 [Monosiga brevicollis MX1]EDQ89712.1 predicted protein [Monosiga brevicollis MX1]|eukprot:XP_001745741.1 hypothetical protein [Monosiga brevicollis MX1]